MQYGSLQGPRENVVPNAGLEESALHEAAASGNETSLDALLAAGADRNAKDHKHGNTPLHEAAWRGFSRCVKALCALPQPKSAKDIKESKLKDVLEDTRGALHSALLGTRNAGGFTALHLASQNGHNQSCREILLAGADPDVQNNYGDTPLHTACRYGHAGATRILLSAKCDPNRTNLNGDTPLHISCAMGRRKLTRILLEAGSSTVIKNAQDEIPRDIALRKNLGEILEILDSPKFIKTQKDREKCTSTRKTIEKNEEIKLPGQKTNSETVANPAKWSPYGCHYFPDPRSFPSPKLETLPKEPLEKGEQYYLDLAGNIRKGPIGVGNTCYCGPFFRHIEERISRNRKSIKKYVHKATERLDNKVQALALRTDDQIEQLTKSLIADRIRCEGRRIHLEQWLRRGNPNRATIAHNTKSKKNLENANTLTRCRSLELLDADNVSDKKMQNSKSFDLLEESNDYVFESMNTMMPTSQRSDSKTSKKSDECRNSNENQPTDHYSVSKCLEKLLIKTSEILDIENVARHRSKKPVPEHLPSEQIKRRNKNVDTSKFAPQNRNTIYSQNLTQPNPQNRVYTSSMASRGINESEYITHEMNRITSSLLQVNSPQEKFEQLPPMSPEITKDFTSRKEFERKSDQEHERASILSGSSHRNASSLGSYIPDFSRIGGNRSHSNSNKSFNSNEYVPATIYDKSFQGIVEEQHLDSGESFKNLITALRKDYHSRKTDDEEIKNEYAIEGESSKQYNSNQFMEQANIQNVLSGFYENYRFNDSDISNINRNIDVNKTMDHEDNVELSDMANLTEINELKSRILNGSNWRSQVLKKSQQQLASSPELIPIPRTSRGISNIDQEDLTAFQSGVLKRSKVQELITKIQDATQIREVHSESSEDEGKSFPNRHNVGTYPNVYHCNHNQSYDTRLIQKHVPSDISTAIIDTRYLIPKDAYFHELPNKNKKRPIVDKLPGKQMINSTDKLKTTNEKKSITAEKRNPIKFVAGCHESTIPGESYLNRPQQHTTTDIKIDQKYIPRREKLLSNRKFIFSNTVNNDVSPAELNQRMEHNLIPLQNILFTSEQAQIERDVNNDSGYSTKIYGSSEPSPSFSKQTDYINTSSTVNTDVHLNDVSYYMENVGGSSLV